MGVYNNEESLTQSVSSGGDIRFQEPPLLNVITDEWYATVTYIITPLKYNIN